MPAPPDPQSQCWVCGWQGHPPTQPSNIDIGVGVGLVGHTRQFVSTLWGVQGPRDRVVKMPIYFEHDCSSRASSDSKIG